MPNNTANILAISGENFDQVKLCVMRLIGQNNFDFNKVLPLPSELIGSNYTHECNRNVYGLPEEIIPNLKDKYGFENWYDWSVANWSTKWNSYSDGEWKFDKINKTAELYFETAWCPPTNVILLLSECEFGSSWHTMPSFTFPDLSFKLKYADEGGGFLGYQVFENGEMEEYELEWSSKEGIDLRKELGYYWEDEDE